MYFSSSPIRVVTHLGGGNGRQPERQTAATRSKMKASSEGWRIGRLCRKAGCERMGAQVRNCHRHRSRELKVSICGWRVKTWGWCDTSGAG